MTSSKVRLEQVADPENLREAFLKAARGKSHRADVIAFRAHLDRELLSLREELLGESVRAGQFTSFTIFEPKERKIHAPCFRERVLHHALVGPCEVDFERWLIPETFACRRGKGREAALRRAEHHASANGWFLKMDVARYFDSIPHAVLLEALERRFRDRRIVALWTRIVEAYQTSPGCGLPIGALTSQHLANFFLAPVDRRVKEVLRLPGYARYMDDMAVWGDRESLKAARIDLEAFLQDSLRLRLKRNWHLQPVSRGMDFLGYRVFPGGSRLNRVSRRRFLRRWQWCETSLDAGELSEAEAQRRILSMVSFVRVARCEKLLGNLFGTFRLEVMGLQPREPRRQLEQHVRQLPFGEPQQE
jgi:hypothetical protein